jgi:hypothetical protein
MNHHDFGPPEPIPGDSVAQLDGVTERRVLCGRRDRPCRNQLAVVRASSHGTVRELVMLPGWESTGREAAEECEPPDECQQSIVCERGVWYETAYSKRQRERGYGGSANRRKQEGAHMDVLTGTMVADTPIDPGAYLHDLPAIAVCSGCGRRNILDADVLRVIDEATRQTHLARTTRRVAN